MIKNFIFDLYGTLIDIITDESDPSFREAYARLFYKKCGNGADFWKEYDSLCAPYANSLEEPELLNIFAQIAKNCGYLPDREELSDLAYKFRTMSRHKLRLYDGAAELLSSLKNLGADIYLLSNAQACFTNREIDETGIRSYFKGIILSSDAGYKKPSRNIFDLLVEKYSLDRAESIYIGNDIESDIRGSINAGLNAAYIRTYNDCPLGKAQKYAGFIAFNHAELKEKLLALL